MNTSMDEQVYTISNSRRSETNLDWQGDDPGVGRADIIIVGHQIDGQPHFVQLCEGAFEICLQCVGSVGGQDWLVDLHLRHTQVLQLGQQPGVGWHQSGHSCGSVNAGTLWLLGQAYQGVGACIVGFGVCWHGHVIAAEWHARDCNEDGGAHRIRETWPNLLKECFENN